MVVDYLGDGVRDFGGGFGVGFDLGVGGVIGGWCIVIGEFFWG